jgi:hypothetical protein
MSKMSEVMIDIEEMYIAGYTATEIRDLKGWPMRWIEEVINSIEYDDSGYDDSMDGDAQSALASAGWGTDEDYGGSVDDSF